MSDKPLSDFERLIQNGKDKGVRVTADAFLLAIAEILLELLKEVRNAKR